jgi:formate hydrogenlyase transcriptional activator
MRAAPTWSGEEKYRLLLAVAEAANSQLDLSQVLEAVALTLRSFVPVDAISVVTVKGEMLRRQAVYVVGVPRVAGEPVEATFARALADHPQALVHLGQPLPFKGSGVEDSAITRRPDVRNDLEREQRFPEERNLVEYGVKCYVRAPLLQGERVLGAIGYARFTKQPFAPCEVEVLADVSRPIASAVANSLAFEEIHALKVRLEEENLALKQDLDGKAAYEEIVGTSAALRGLIAQIERVAPTDSTVLLTGETGTGKELAARAIHRRSARAGRPMITVNSAALPTSLVASELFGHERGAFTGALQRHKGRFELADGGTLFLDEVGDLPPDAQMALLRVLQEGTFERVGGSGTIRTDVRVIAATHRDLGEEVAAGRFRQDLYFRLNIFPIRMPSLRERPEDVSLLVEHFAARHGTRLGKAFGRVDRRDVARLVRYDWPGNVRELENLVERAVILSDGEVLRFHGRFGGAGLETDFPLRQSLRESERRRIEQALHETCGRVSGPNGAARRLRLPSTTLESKIRRLGIDKYAFRRLRGGRIYEES